MISYKQTSCQGNCTIFKPSIFIHEYGAANSQPDREQFCVILLNAKNEVIGLNIVSTGSICGTIVHPREVFKPAILANASAIILCHNHPSDGVEPSTEDKIITKAMVKAAKIIDIRVHEHLIISMYEDRFYSFCDNGLIERYYREAGVDG